MVLEKFDIVYVNPKYGTIEGAVRRYNRTNYVLNINFTLARDITEKNDVNVSIV